MWPIAGYEVKWEWPIILLSAVVEVPEVQSGMVPFHILIPCTACSDYNCGGLGTKLEIKGRTVQVANP